MREEDWNDPIDSREEGSQKFASKAANAAAAAAAVALKVPVLITSAEVNAVIAAPLPSAAKKGSNAKVIERIPEEYMIAVEYQITSSDISILFYSMRLICSPNKSDVIRRDRNCWILPGF